MSLYARNPFLYRAWWKAKWACDKARMRRLTTISHMAVLNDCGQMVMVTRKAAKTAKLT